MRPPRSTESTQDALDVGRLEEISLQQLRTFKFVMDKGGYAAAAKQISLSVPSVWQHIRALERIYGTKLFEKSGRQVLPTAAAKRLYCAIDEILVRAQSTFSLAKTNQGEQPIRLVSGVRMLIEDLAPHIDTFRKSNNSQLILRHGNNTRAEELLLSDEADLALTLAPGYQKENPLLTYEPAYKVEFIAVAKKSHPFAKNKSKSLQELIKHDLVVTLPGTHGRDALDQALHATGLEARIAAETDNSGFTVACASSGIGVGILAGRTDGQLCRSLYVTSLREQLGDRQIVFMWRRGRLLTESMLELIEIIRAVD